MTLLTLDFETFYDRDYSLSKMTTEAYIRDPRFETIGVCVKKDNGYGVWFSGTHTQIKQHLQKYPWETATVVAHNAVFDLAILNWVFDIRPKRIIDTLSMARALGHGSVSLKALAECYNVGEKGDEVVRALGKRRGDFTGPELQEYGNYCRNDVELTYAILQEMGVGFPANEFKLIDLTIRMFTEPVLELDVSLLIKHLGDVRETKDRLLSYAKIDKEQLMSNDKLAVLLTSIGVDPPTKISPATGKETWAFAKSDEEFTALLEHESIMVQAVVAARLGVKSTMEETRTERLIGVAKRGKFSVPIRYYAAHTGRWGGDDKVNIQNLGRGSPIKKAILPPEGHVFIHADSSQIEARTLAWLAEQDDLVEAFENGEDVYRDMAAAIFDKPADLITVNERFVGKTTILGAGYGVAGLKLQRTLAAAPNHLLIDMSLDDCHSVITTYRKKNYRIPELWDEGMQAIHAMIGDRTAPLGREGVLVVEGRYGIRLPNGLYLQYPNLRAWNNPETHKMEYVYDTRKGRSVVQTKLYGGKIIENVCQALARIIIGEQMLLMRKKYRVVLTVHDSIGAIAPKDETDRALEYVELCMRMRPAWAQELPLDCEAAYGSSYGAC